MITEVTSTQDNCGSGPQPPSFYDTLVPNHQYTSPQTSITGDVKIGGSLYLDGSMYQATAREVNPPGPPVKHDVYIEVVDNGYLICIGPRASVFTDMESVENWIRENLNTPEKAKDNIMKARGINKTQQGLLDALKDYTQITPYAPYTIGTGTGTGNVYNTTSGGSIFAGNKIAYNSN